MECGELIKYSRGVEIAPVKAKEEAGTDRAGEPRGRRGFEGEHAHLRPVIGGEKYDLGVVRPKN